MKTIKLYNGFGTRPPVFILEKDGNVLATRYIYAAKSWANTLCDVMNLWQCGNVDAETLRYINRLDKAQEV